jgi:hypothetical protein
MDAQGPRLLIFVSYWRRALGNARRALKSRMAPRRPLKLGDLAEPALVFKNVVSCLWRAYAARDNPVMCPRVRL